MSSIQKNRHAGIHDARAQRRLVGLGDQQMSMFASPLWQQLRTRVVRYVSPYYAAVRRGSRARATAWIEAAEAQHQQILVASTTRSTRPQSSPACAYIRRTCAASTSCFRAYASTSHGTRRTAGP